VGVVAKERHDGPELGCHRPGLVFLPVDVGVALDAHSLGCFPLQKAKLPTPLLEMLA
jgi:hypothetical protein